jgi:hypothetical protein
MVDAARREREGLPVPLSGGEVVRRKKDGRQNVGNRGYTMRKGAGRMQKEVACVSMSNGVEV